MSAWRKFMKVRIVLALASLLVLVVATGGCEGRLFTKKKGAQPVSRRRPARPPAPEARRPAAAVPRKASVPQVQRPAAAKAPEPKAPEPKVLPVETEKVLPVETEKVKPVEPKVEPQKPKAKDSKNTNRRELDELLSIE